MRTPYIKPTRYKHDSGFRCFEVGYCDIDKNGNATDIKVLGRCSDHIWLVDHFNLKKDLNLDLTMNGYIRIYQIGNRKSMLKWDLENFAISTMRLKEQFIEPSIKSNNKQKGGNK